MTCTRIGNTIVCTSPTGRLHVGNKYIMVEMHSYCGPTFFTDRNCSIIYEPIDETDPVWPEFTKWNIKHEEAKAKQKMARFKAQQAKEQAVISIF